jgi:diguanylate cyclase (GGDEF)-like protein
MVSSATASRIRWAVLWAAAALLLLDLDHFKRVNDRMGHLAGDAALAAVALVLRRNVRRDDLVGRFGGEEFVVFLPDSTAPAAHNTAQRIREAVAELTIPVISQAGGPAELSDLTVSIGVATTTRFGFELAPLLAAADAALLAAKGAGRNLVTMA